MKDQTLLSTPRPLLTGSVPGVFTALLLAAALFAAGFLSGKTQDAAQVAGPGSEKPVFALLVHNDDIPPEEPSRQFKEYSTWVRGLKTARFADGEALHGKAWMLRQPGDSLQVNPVSLTGNTDAISGYFVFEAADADEAIHIAGTCPHLKYSGTLELREIYR
ncbi:MAG: hypothetical protein H6565_14740 [Lewinellaceae bacterium]|nr:hypothetical protein [Lewinellaceae bacterium]